MATCMHFFHQLSLKFCSFCFFPPSSPKFLLLHYPNSCSHENVFIIDSIVESALVADFQRFCCWWGAIQIPQSEGAHCPRTLGGNAPNQTLESTLQGWWRYNRGGESKRLGLIRWYCLPISRVGWFWSSGMGPIDLSQVFVHFRIYIVFFHSD